jgi:hypothetical protein
MYLNRATAFYTALFVTNFVGERSAKTTEYKKKKKATFTSPFIHKRALLFTGVCINEGGQLKPLSVFLHEWHNSRTHARIHNKDYAYRVSL